MVSPNPEIGAQAAVHPSAEIDPGARIGTGTKIWHNCHVRKDAAIGSDCRLGRNTYVDVGVRIGDRVKIQNNVSIYGGVEIESDVFIGPDAVFTNDLYPRGDGWTESRRGHTQLMQGASIGANATIVCGGAKPGRKIGAWSMIAAGAVVASDVPAYGLVLGNPAHLTGIVCGCGAVARHFRSSEEAVAQNLKCGKCGKEIRFDPRRFEGV